MNVDGASGLKPVISVNGEGEKVRDEKAEIRQLSEDFESLFLGIVLKAMRDTVPKSGLVDGGNAEEIYRSMLDGEYAKQMASQRHTGLADNIEEFMLRARGAQEAAKAEGGANGVKAMGLKAYAPKALPPAPIPATMNNGPVPADLLQKLSRPL